MNSVKPTCLGPNTHEMFSLSDVEPNVDIRVVRDPCFDMFTHDILQYDNLTLFY